MIKGSDWEAKTEELASRGISLSDLLEFYSNLGVGIMPSFQPDVHTTNDVVRLGIIPRTSSACSSYAEFVNDGKKVIPKKMVTHNWQNLFRDLLASVIADALGEHNFELIAKLLSDKEGVEVVEQILQVQDGSRASSGNLLDLCVFSQSARFNLWRKPQRRRRSSHKNPTSHMHLQRSKVLQ